MRTRRRRLLVLVLAAVLVVAGTTWAVWYAHRPVPVVVDPACPPLLRGVPNATEDFGDSVDWHGQTYWRSEARARAGKQVGVVTCSVTRDLGGHGWRVAPGPWPDGTATGLPRGTPLHVPREPRTREALVARTAEGDRLYCVEDERAGMSGC